MYIQVLEVVVVQEKPVQQKKKTEEGLRLSVAFSPSVYGFSEPNHLTSK
jgi:hypothetical protein